MVNGIAYATAVDLTNDPAHGCDAHAWAEYLRRARDARIKYVISRSRMFSSYPVRGIPAWTWRTYTGSNPHDKHCHVSIRPEAVLDTAPWFPQLVSIDPLMPEDDMYSDTDRARDNKIAQQVQEIHDAIYKGHPEYGQPGLEGMLAEIRKKIR